MKGSRVKLRNLVKKDPQRQLWDSISLVLFIAFVISLFNEGYVLDMIFLFLQTQVSFISLYLRRNDREEVLD